MCSLCSLSVSLAALALARVAGTLQVMTQAKRRRARAVRLRGPHARNVMGNNDTVGMRLQYNGSASRGHHTHVTRPLLRARLSPRQGTTQALCGGALGSTKINPDRPQQIDSAKSAPIASKSMFLDMRSTECPDRLLRNTFSTRPTPPLYPTPRSPTCAPPSARIQPVSSSTAFNSSSGICK